MHHMPLQEDKALYQSLYTLPAIVLLAAVAVSYVGLGFVMPLRALYARQIGASSVEVGLMATVFLLASFVVTPVMGWLADRVGYRTVLGLSLLTSAGLLAACVPITSPGTLIALRALEGVSASGVLPPARAATDGLLADHVPQGLQGRIHALFSAAGTAGSLVGAMVSGVLYAIEPGMPLLAMGVLYLLVPVALLMVPARRHLCGVGDATNSLELSEGSRVWRCCSIDLGELECDHEAGRDDQPGRLGHRGAALRRGGSPPVA
jgi:MFS family permease